MVLRVTPSFRRFVAFLRLAALPALLGACSAIPPEPGEPGARPRDAVEDLLAAERSRAAVDLQIDERAVVRGTLGENLLRIAFSFRSYDGYPVGRGDRRSSGTLFLPVGPDGEARPSVRGEVVLTEFPPGASTSGLTLFPEYGERPAVELGLAAAVIDVRGPVVQELRTVPNPYSPDGAYFTGEEQFGLAMLRRFQETADPSQLWEVRVASAWMRAIAAVEELVAQETGVADSHFLLAGDGYGAVGAARAAASDRRVVALALCGWPLDWADFNWVRWRRWELEARYDPLAALRPLPWRDSRDLVSFLRSTWTAPDPGCPRCEGAGQEWLAQLDVKELWAQGRLNGVETLVLVGDSDPRFPLDLEARASADPALLEGHPGGRESGPFAEGEPRPFRDVCYLPGSASTLASSKAADAVLAWAQHMAGYRDVPRIRVQESLETGDVRIDVLVNEGNTAVSDVTIRLTEITDRRDSDFKWSLHLTKPEPMTWREVGAHYGGPVGRTGGRWTGYFPIDPTRDRAYYVVVRDRVGDLVTEHSMPVRALWNLGDPAGPGIFYR